MVMVGRVWSWWEGCGHGENDVVMGYDVKV